MKVGRPTKLTREFIDALTDVVMDNNVVYLTDEDLIFLLNEKLPPEDRIAINTFRDYKTGRRQSENLLIVEFAALIKKALVAEKQSLLDRVDQGANGWQSKAWILERKFAEWNLHKITKTDLTSLGESINKEIVLPPDLTFEQLKELSNGKTKP